MKRREISKTEFTKSYYPILFKYNCLRRRKSITQMILLVSFSVITIIIVSVGLFDVVMESMIEILKHYLNL